MSTATKLQLLMAMGTARVVRKTLAGEMRLDHKRMALLIFDQDFLRRFQNDSFIMRDLLKHEWVTRQLKEAGHGGVIVLPQEKRFMFNLFPFLMGNEGLYLIAIQPEDRSVATLDRVLIFQDDGHVVIG